MDTRRRKNWSVVILLCLLAVVLALAGCGGKARITEAGSTTVQPLAEKLAEAFMEDNPDVEVIIQAGGSSTGVKSCNEGTVDIGAASRELKPEEPDLITHLLARDGIAIVVHPSNPVAGLTTEEVRSIFAGDITNWSEVGGDDEAITVIAREEGSGTRTAFEEMVMGEELVTATAILQPSNGTIRTAVASTPASIGFMSFGYVDEAVKSLAIDGVEGSAENAKTGTYPIVRPLYFLTKEEPEGLVKDFIDFCLGSEGQDIVQDQGYIRVD